MNDPERRSVENRLRDARAGTADAVRPDPMAAAHIDARRAARADPTAPPPARTFGATQWWLLGGAVAAAVMLLVAGLVIDRGDDADLVATADATTTSTEDSATTEPSTTDAPQTTTTVVTSGVLDDPVAYPFPEMSRTFTNPVSLAIEFAEEVLGFDAVSLAGADPDAAPPDENPDESPDGNGDERAVAVTAGGDGPVTTVHTEARDDGTWVVGGATTPDVTVTDPDPGAAIPIGDYRPSGSAVAFEGTVEVVVRRVTGVMGTGVVTGSGTPPARAFTGTWTVDAVAERTAAVVVFRTRSAQDGRVTAATAVPVTVMPFELEQPTPPTVPTDAACAAPATGALEGDERVVIVSLTCEEDGLPVPVPRVVSAATTARLAQAMRQLVAGPTAAELDAGLASVFPAAVTVGRVAIVDGTAEIDLVGGPGELADSPEAVAALVGQVRRTATQFATVSRIRITFDGSCPAFENWSRLGTCAP